MKRGRWAVALQLMLWVLLAPPFVLKVVGLQGLPRFVLGFLLVACAVGLYFFNFRSCDRNVETARKLFIYLLTMAAVTLIAGGVYSLAALIFIMKNGM
jgi:hypothetical protein